MNKVNTSQRLLELTWRSLEAVGVSLLTRSSATVCVGSVAGADCLRGVVETILLQREGLEEEHECEWRIIGSGSGSLYEEWRIIGEELRITGEE